MIFVSSTYVDLIEERQAVIRALQTPGYDAVGGMEFFLSEPREPLDVCLEEVSRAIALVVIVGFKAGSLVPKARGLTYTGAEVEAAISRGIRIFAFFKTKGGVWRNDETDPALRDALDQFKTRVLSVEKNAAYVSSPNDLALRAVQSLHAWENLGRPGGRQVFGTRDEFVREGSGQTKYFRHDSPLHGRSEVLAALGEFLSDPLKTVAMLGARGGQGKSKLLYDWTNSLDRQWTVLFVRPRAMWHPHVAREIPAAGNILLVLDDAHRETELFDRLLLLVNKPGHGGTRQVKVVAAHRPSGDAVLMTIASRRLGSEAVSRLPQMKALGFRDLRAIAEDILPDQLRPHAHRLAVIAGDSPLVVTVSARMVAARDVQPALLDDARFKDEVLGRFYSDHASESEVATRRPLLNLLAAIGPVPEGAAWFQESAARLLSLPVHEVLQGCEALVTHGLAIRTRGGTRIMPDVLSEHLFRQASITSTGVPTGYIDALFTEFGRSAAFGPLLTNASELGWNLKQAGISFLPGESLWSGLRRGIAAASLNERKTMLQAVRNAAFYEPGPALAVISEVIEDATEDDDVIGILSAAAHHPDYTDEAVSQLWRLAQLETRRENSHPNHAGRVLKELAEFAVNRHIDLSDRILALAERRGRDKREFIARFTPLDIADAILKKYVEHQESDDETLYLSSRSLNYPVVKPLRDRALSLIRTVLSHDSSLAQARAVESLRSIFQAGIRPLGRGPSEEEGAWQDDERVRAIGLIEERSGRDGIEPFLLFCLKRALVDYEGRPDSPVHLRVRSALRRLPRDRDAIIYSAVSSASWDYSDTPTVFEKRIRRATKALARCCPDAKARVDRFRWLTETADIFDVFEDNGGRALCEQLCDDPAFLSALTELVFVGDVVSLTQYLSVVAAAVRTLDPSQCRELLSRALSSTDVDTRGAAVHGIAYRDGARSELDIQILAEAGTDGSSFVRKFAINGLRIIANQHPELASAAIDALSRISPRGDKDTAAEWCGALTSVSKYLSSEQVLRIVDELVGVDALDEFHVGDLLQSLIETHPREIATLLVRRLEEHAARSAEMRYRYRPVPNFYRQNLHALAPHSKDLLLTFRDQLLAAPEHLCSELRNMFWCAGGPGNEALTLVDEWLHSADSRIVARALELLAEGPERLFLTRPAFAGHMLHVCTESGLRRRAMQVLISNSRPNSWSRTRGSVPEEHSRIVADAIALAKKWQGSFVAEAMMIVAEEIDAEAQSITKQDW